MFRYHFSSSKGKDQLTWKPFLVSRWKESSRWRDRRRSVPARHHIRLHRVSRRKFQHLLLLLASSTSAATRRERFHGRQETDSAHLLLLGFRVCTLHSSLRYYMYSLDYLVVDDSVSRSIVAANVERRFGQETSRVLVSKLGLSTRSMGNRRDRWMGNEQISETWPLMACVHDSLPDLMISMMSVRFMADDSACRLLRTITKVVLRRTTTARPLLCSRFFFYSFELIRNRFADFNSWNREWNFIGLIRHFCSEEFLWN